MVRGPVKKRASHAREPLLQVGLKGLGHRAFPKEKLLALEEQANLRHKVRARSIARQMHGHLKLWRRKKAVGAAGLAVKVDLGACMFVMEGKWIKVCMIDHRSNIAWE